MSYLDGRKSSTSLAKVVIAGIVVVGLSILISILLPVDTGLTPRSEKAVIAIVGATLEAANRNSLAANGSHIFDIVEIRQNKDEFDNQLRDYIKLNSGNLVPVILYTIYHISPTYELTEIEFIDSENVLSTLLEANGYNQIPVNFDSSFAALMVSDPATVKGIATPHINGLILFADETIVLSTVVRAEREGSLASLMVIPNTMASTGGHYEDVKGHFKERWPDDWRETWDIREGE